VGILILFVLISFTQVPQSFDPATSLLVGYMFGIIDG
jgi:hypothetical protein